MADKKKSDPDADTKPESDAVEIGTDAEDQIDSDLTSDADPEPDLAPEDETDASEADVFEPDAVLDPDTDGALEEIQSEDLDSEPDVVEDYVEPAPIIAEPGKIVERVIEKRSGFVPALIGGVVAAGLGFFAARSDVLDSFFPGSLKSADISEAMAALDKSVTDHTATLATLDKKVAAIQTPDLAPVETKIDALSKQVDALKAAAESQNADLSKQLTALDTRLTKLEKQPVSDGVSESAIDAYERELTKLQAAISKQRTDVEALVDEARKKEAEARALDAQAAAAAKDAANQAVLAQVSSALDAGSPFGGLLSELTANGVTVPDALTTAAKNGVSTMFVLREGFPPAARAALDAVRSDSDSKDQSVSGFLQKYLGARSVEPREGSDPDAVLSRAEAALKTGHLSEALDEISALPKPAQAALADWVNLANTRMAAVKAVDTLAQSLKTN